MCFIPVNENIDLLIILNKHQEKYLLSFIIINILYLTRNKHQILKILLFVNMQPQFQDLNFVFVFFCHKVHSKFVLS